MAVIKDVARQAGVSVGTVSKYLNGVLTLKEDTRTRVEAAIRDLHYTPSPLARSMRTGRSNTLAVVVPDIANPFFAEVFDAIRQAAAETGQTLILYATGDGAERLEQHLADIAGRNVDGIILCFVDENPVIDAWLEEIQRTIPVVLLTWDTHNTTFHAVSVDVYEGMMQATQHILSISRKRIAYVGGPERSITSQHKFAGFLKTMAEAGVEVPPENIHRGEFSLKTGYIAANRFMMLTERPDAIIAENDIIAIGCMKNLIRRGICIPEEIAVIGFDNVLLASMVEPALTTLSLPIAQMGTEALRLITSALEKPGTRKRLVILSGELVVRNSTDKSAPVVVDF